MDCTRASVNARAKAIIEEWQTRLVISLVTTPSVVTNLDQPHKNWSPWSSAVTDPKGARVNSPAARFAQWKATLTAGSAGFAS